MASANISRRGFFGHAAGAYSAIALTTGTAVTVSLLKSRIDRHAATWAVLGTATDDMDYPRRSPPPDVAERQARYEAADEAETAALTDLLKFRPQTLEENADRLRYLHRVPWEQQTPGEWQWELLLESMTA